MPDDNAEVIKCYLRNNKKGSGNVVFIKNYNEEINYELKHLSEEQCLTKDLVLNNSYSISSQFYFFIILIF